MREDKAPDGMTFGDRLADGQCRPNFSSQAAVTAPVASGQSAQGGLKPPNKGEIGLKSPKCGESAE